MRFSHLTFSTLRHHPGYDELTQPSCRQAQTHRDGRSHLCGPECGGQSQTCPVGQLACPITVMTESVYAAAGDDVPWECVFPEEDLYSCGGCAHAWPVLLELVQVSSFVLLTIRGVCDILLNTTTAPLF
ncbi:hypothetical protein IAR50_000365 [Cryptococcus sp. DSM 104548]